MQFAIVAKGATSQIRNAVKFRNNPCPGNVLSEVVKKYTDKKILSNFTASGLQSPTPRHPGVPMLVNSTV